MQGFPRIRGGDPISEKPTPYVRLVFPASAGVIPQGREHRKGMSGFPRIRGGDPSETGGGFVAIEFSPHPRG